MSLERGSTMTHTRCCISCKACSAVSAVWDGGYDTYNCGVGKLSWNGGHSWNYGV